MRQEEIAGVRIVREQRKSICLRVKRDGSAELRAPHAVPERLLRAFLAEKEDWLARHCAARLEEKAERERNLAARPTELPLLGKSCPVCTGPRAGVEEGRYLLPPGSFAEHLPALRRAVQQLAAAYLPERTAELAAQFGYTAPPVRVTLAASRWGSCSAQNRICLSYKLIFADPKAVDYVILHELAHLRHKNHGAEFWAEVERNMPDRRAAEKRLRELQRSLAAQGWDEREKSL